MTHGVIAHDDNVPNVSEHHHPPYHHQQPPHNVQQQHHHLQQHSHYVAADSSPHGDGGNHHHHYQHHCSDLYIRPGFLNADLALCQINEGKAQGDRNLLWIRGRIQYRFNWLGLILDTHAGKVLFVSMLALATFFVGLKSLTFHSDIELLWAEPAALTYSSPEMLVTHQMIVQTGVVPEGLSQDNELPDLLHAHGLLEHLELVQRATQVTINMFDITWRLKDLCHSPSIPHLEAHYIEQIFEQIMPCSISTALDCFWEGSKLLGPDFPVRIPYGVGNQLKWTNLNPSKMISEMKAKESQFDYHSLEDYLRRAGITTGYQEKPCLNPLDPDCPLTAPNYNSTQMLDIGAELTSGCYGFAAKYMHWPEELIVGGVLKNKTGHIKQAKALQTVVQLMGEHEFYEFWSGHYKVHHIGWSEDKAKLVMHSWQKKFAEEVERLEKVREPSSSSCSFVTFSAANLNRVLREYSRMDWVKMAAVLGVMGLYAGVIYGVLASLGVLVLASSAAAALGICSLLALPANLLSLHVLPFLTVGMAMRDIFLILTESINQVSMGTVLQRCGPIVMATTCSQAGAFLVSAMVPVPALRTFCLQAAIHVLCHGVSLLIVFGSLIALKQRWKKADPTGSRKHNERANAQYQASQINVGSLNEERVNNESELLQSDISKCKRNSAYIEWAVRHYVTPLIVNPHLRVVFCLLYAIAIVMCVLNGIDVKFDIRLSSFLPRNTQEYKYLEWHDRYFGFYNFYIVTTDLEYPHSQPLLYEYHASLTTVPFILKDSNGGMNMNDFWLANFRDYLLDLQQEFQHNRNISCITNERWYANATEKAVLAFKLLTQTGIVEFPVDKSQVYRRTLVRNGIVDPKAFYNHLTVWNSDDQISYSSSHANLIPKPFQYYSTKTEYDLKIPKSQPLVYAQMPFYLKNLKNTERIMQAMSHIKEITFKFNERGVKSYPTGLIFVYFNQFLVLGWWLATLTGLTFIAAALIFSIYLVHWSKMWCPILNIFIALLTLCLDDINAVTSIAGAIGFIVVSRNVFLIYGAFSSIVGGRERRLTVALNKYCHIVVLGDIALAICLAVLFLSHFQFIQCQLVPTVLRSVCASLLNSLVFLPVFLMAIGTKSELHSLEYGDRIGTPDSLLLIAKPTTNTLPTGGPKTSKRPPPGNTARKPSLTTITEESCNQSIVLEPQLTVEYSNASDTNSNVSSHGTVNATANTIATANTTTTKVTATANFKVEIVGGPSHRHKTTTTTSSSSNSSSGTSSSGSTTCHCHRSPPPAPAPVATRCRSKPPMVSSCHKCTSGGGGSGTPKDPNRRIADAR